MSPGSDSPDSKDSPDSDSLAPASESDSAESVRGFSSSSAHSPGADAPRCGGDASDPARPALPARRCARDGVLGDCCGDAPPPRRAALSSGGEADLWWLRSPCTACCACPRWRSRSARSLRRCSARLLSSPPPWRERRRAPAPPASTSSLGDASAGRNSGEPGPALLLGEPACDPGSDPFAARLIMSSERAKPFCTASFRSACALSRPFDPRGARGSRLTRSRGSPGRSAGSAARSGDRCWSTSGGRSSPSGSTRCSRGARGAEQSCNPPNRLARSIALGARRGCAAPTAPATPKPKKSTREITTSKQQPREVSGRSLGWGADRRAREHLRPVRRCLARWETSLWWRNPQPEQRCTARRRRRSRLTAEAENPGPRRSRRGRDGNQR